MSSTELVTSATQESIHPRYGGLGAGQPTTSPGDSGSRLVVFIAIAFFVLEMCVAARYGFHTDELYLLACGEHLSWGYIDHPPLTPLIAFLTRHLLGTSIVALRAVPAFAGTLLVWITGKIAQELGGARFAQGAAAVAVAVTPAYLMVHHILLILAFDPLAWSVCALFAIRSVRRNDPNQLVWLGIAAGLGFELKYSIAAFVAGILLGLMLTNERKLLWRWQAFAGAITALLIALPNAVWEIVHGFPFLVWQRYIRQHPEIQTFNASVTNFLRNQAMLALPSLVFLLAGIWFYLFSRVGKQFRFIGTAIVFVFVICSLSGKPHYAIPVFACTLAGGAVEFEALTAESEWRWLRSVLMLLVVGAGVILAPCFLPIFGPERLVLYQRSLPLPLPIRSEFYEAQQELPQHLAWELGWDEIVRSAAALYQSLPAADRSKVGVLAVNYGQAGAIDLLGERYGLPKAACGQLSYHDWGSHGYTGEVLITIGPLPEQLATLCDSVETGPYVVNPYGYPSTKGRVVNLCRGLSFDLSREWQAQKHY